MPVSTSSIRTWGIHRDHIMGQRMGPRHGRDRAHSQALQMILHPRLNADTSPQDISQTVQIEFGNIDIALVHGCAPLISVSLIACGTTGGGPAANFGVLTVKTGQVAGRNTPPTASEPFARRHRGGHGSPSRSDPDRWRNAEARIASEAMPPEISTSAANPNEVTGSGVPTVACSNGLVFAPPVRLHRAAIQVVADRFQHMHQRDCGAGPLAS